jgi:signal-transduction protein with cAMP-binding, CBS, and nucleotidyltransferase domain
MLTGLRLRHQVEQVGDGRAADNRIPLEHLSVAERRRLRDVLRVVRDVQEVTDLRFPTQSVT